LTKRIKKTVALTVNCQIDNHGNTIKVMIRNRDHTIPDDDVKELTARLTDIFMNDIKWIPNKERFPFEVVSIPLRFMVVDDN
jgi:lauroyl/myristoyl acyltransferase